MMLCLQMTLDEKLQETWNTISALSEAELEIENAAGLILDTLKEGRRIFTCGNGGSAAEAQHFATELTGRYKRDRASLPAISLNSDPSLLSCIANDYGWNAVFSRQIEGLAGPGDLLVCLSTSGNSGNIIAALHTARERDIGSIALLGKGGGEAKGLAKCEVIVPGTETAAVQEAHLVLIHYFCERIESAFS